MRKIHQKNCWLPMAAAGAAASATNTTQITERITLMNENFLTLSPMVTPLPGVQPRRAAHALRAARPGRAFDQCANDFPELA